MTGENPYKRTAICAWLIAAAAHRDLHDRAHTLIEKVRPLIKTIEPPLSRADALALFWQAAVPLGPRAYEPLVRELVDVASSLQPSPYRRLKSRARAHIALLVLQLWNLNRPLADEVLAADIDPAHAQRTRARAEKGETYSTFFA